MVVHNTYTESNPTRLGQTLYNSKQEWTSESIHETCIQQTTQRQQQSAGKHVHIPEQLMQPRHAMQQYMDHGHIS